MDEEVEQLIDRIYEAAAVPELWPRVLQGLMGLTGAAGASLVTAGPAGLRWLATPGIDALIQEHQSGGGPPNSRIEYGLANEHAKFLTDHDIFTPEQIAADPFYTEFMHPRGYGWFAGTVITPPSSDPIAVSVERNYRDGPIGPASVRRLDALRPHIARAAQLSVRLDLESARSAANALAMLGLPAAVLGRQFALVAANPLFEDMISTFVLDRRERITLRDKAADELLERALHRLDRKANAGVRSIPLAGAEDRTPMILHLLPVKGAGRDVFAGATALAIMTPVAPGPSPEPRLLAGLFDLTPAEARIARGIAEGSTIETIAEALGVSRETVRSQLKAVFAKTGTTRQAELVRLLGSVSPLLRRM